MLGGAVVAYVIAREEAEEFQVDLEALVAEWCPVIEPAIRRTCAHWHVAGGDADDLAQELWLYLLRNDGRVLRRFQERSTKSTYLFSVLHGVACDFFKSKQAKRRCEVQGGDMYGYGNAPSMMYSLERSDGEHQERLRKVRAALRHLDAFDRTMIEQRLDGISAKAIAAQRGLCVKTVQNRTCHTIRRLRGLTSNGCREK